MKSQKVLRTRLNVERRVEGGVRQWITLALIQVTVFVLFMFVYVASDIQTRTKAESWMSHTTQSRML